MKFKKDFFIKNIMEEYNEPHNLCYVFTKTVCKVIALNIQEFMSNKGLEVSLDELTAVILGTTVEELHTAVGNVENAIEPKKETKKREPKKKEPKKEKEVAPQVKEEVKGNEGKEETVIEETVMEEDGKGEEAKADGGNGCVHILTRAVKNKNKQKEKGEMCGDPCVVGKNLCKQHSKGKAAKGKQVAEEQLNPAAVEGMAVKPNEEDKEDHVIRPLSTDDFVFGIGEYEGYQFVEGLGYLVKQCPSGHIAEFIKTENDDKPRPLTEEEKEVAKNHKFLTVAAQVKSPKKEKEVILEAEVKEEKVEEEVKDEKVEVKEEPKVEMNEQMLKFMNGMKTLSEKIPEFGTFPEQKKMTLVTMFTNDSIAAFPEEQRLNMVKQMATTIN